MMKRFIFVITTLLVLLCFTIPVSAADFTDTEHWSKNYINYTVEKGYFAGTSNTTFEPDTVMTRGMFVAVLGRYEQSKGNINLNDYKLSPFVDIATEAYYTKAALWAYENDIVIGINSNTFAPDSPITREQAATILTRYLDLDEELSLDITTVYKDWKDISSWAVDGVAAATQHNLFVGYDNKFNPKNGITRAEMAVLIARLDGKTFDLYEVPQEPAEKLTLVGTFSNTFYCPGSCCNGKWAGVTASGAKPTPGTTIAVDPRVIPLGTKVYIEFENESSKCLNGYYIAQDTGGAIKGYRVDVLVSYHDEAKDYGVGKCKIYIVKE